MTARPPGAMLTGPVHLAFPDGGRLPVHPGGDLHFVLPPEHDDFDRAVTVTALASIRPVKEPDPERPLFLIAVMLTDAAGQPWQMEYAANIAELWYQAATEPMFARAPTEPRHSRGVDLERAERVVLPEQGVLVDGGGRRALVLVDAEPAFAHERGVPSTFMYLVPERSSGMRVEMIEVRQRAAKAASWQSWIALRIWFDTEYPLVAKLDARDTPIALAPGEQRDLSANNPVRASRAHLPQPWRARPLPVASRSDPRAWRDALAAAGGAADLADRAFDPSPGVHFRPAANARG